MDEEVENVINVMFPTGLPGHLHDSPEFLPYLSKLGALKLDDLIKEPERLSEEKSSVLEMTQELAFSNYKTFIQTAECSRAIFKQFKETEEHVDNLLTRLPKLSEQCHDLSRASSGMESQRRLCALTLSRSTQILELLEIPQLMELCVSSGHYEEALQLATFVRRLERRYNSIPAIESIVKDTQAAWQSMLLQLLSQLRSDLPLPKCLLIVGLLRRMEVFSEAELRLKFLQARDAWLQAQLSSIPQDGDHLSRTIELSRQHLFAIATQYRAAFNEDPARTTNNEGAIFYGWLTEKVSQFITTLDNDLLKLGENEPLDSILSQCMYFGLSLARVGADFRALIAPIFVKAIKRNFERVVRKANRDFEYHMEKFIFDNVQFESTQNSSTSGSSNHPPSSLLMFPPLALYCNALVTGMNTLRLCAPLALADFITAQLQMSTSAAAKAILTRYRQEQQAFTSSEKLGVQKLCACFADDLVYHLQKCLSALYPSACLAVHLGHSPHQVEMAGLGLLNKSEITECISHLLPVQLEPINFITNNLPEKKDTDNRENESTILSSDLQAVEQLEASPPEKLAETTKEQLSKTTQEQLLETTREQLWETTREQLWETTREQLTETTQEQLTETTQEQLTETTQKQLLGTKEEQLIPNLMTDSRQEKEHEISG